MSKDSDHDRRSVADDRRHEHRYPVVGIAVLYSPSEGKCLEDAGQLVREAFTVDMSLSGLSFDVTEPLEPGDELFIEIADAAGGPAERVLAEVKWCREIDVAHYRIGTQIMESTGFAGGVVVEDVEAKPIGRGLPVPSEVDFRCPACANQTIFTLVGLQSGTWEQGLMPLYQCTMCQSARSITSVLAYNRDVADP